jgi:multidrug efflux pump subunit AcrA (membrane-fusion protein)
MKLKVLAIVVLLVVGGAAVFVAVGGIPRTTAAATTYLTAAAAIGDVSDDVAATGSVASAATWSLVFGDLPTTGTVSTSTSSNGGSTGSWTVKDVKVKVGDTVAKDQLLATATNPTLGASIDAAANDVTSTRLQYLNAKDAYDNASGTNALRQTRVGLLNATNAWDQARANLADLQTTAARSKLVAPAAGVVTAVNVLAGLGPPSGAAITIDTASYEVTADVVESDVSSIQLGQAANITVSAIGASLTGTVTAIAPTATSSTSSSSVVNYAVTTALA